MPENFIAKFAYRLISATGAGLISLVEKILFEANTPAIYPSEVFDWTKTLEQHYPLIKRELEQVMQQYSTIPELKSLSEEQERIVIGNHWKSFFFYAYGRAIDKNCTLCPKTVRALQHIPGMRTAFFSIMAPDTCLLPHRGLYKGVLRYHLALKVPKDFTKCVLKINHHELHWHEGESLIFDDTYEHEAWNKSNEVRVVLFVDFIRPMRFPASMINECILWLFGRSPFIQRILDRA